MEIIPFFLDLKKISSGVNLGAYEALVELLLKSETYGCFPDSASLCYLLLNLVENGENQLAVEACLDLIIKDLCGNQALAKLCLNIILSNIGTVLIVDFILMFL